MVPAFKFVLVFIALFLSDLHKAVRMPIVSAQNSSAAVCLESIALNGDDGWHHIPGTYQATLTFCWPLSNRIVLVKKMDSPRTKSREKRRSANRTEHVHQQLYANRISHRQIRDFAR